MKKRLLDLIPSTAVTATFVVGFALTVMATAWLQEHNRAQAEVALNRAVERTSQVVSTRIRLYQYGLRGVQGAVQVLGEDQISRSLFLTYSKTRDMAREFPGARGFGFIRRVPAAEEAAFLKKARADGKPDFAIRQLTPHDGERFVIQYVEPVHLNLAAVGLDIASEKNRREAAEAALRTGEARLTGPITLVQASGKLLQSFLFLLPIYRAVDTPANEAERLAQGFGWSYAPLLTEDVLTGLPLPSEGVRLLLRDVTDPAAPVQFYERQQRDSDDLESMRAHMTQDVFGRRWDIELVAYPRFAQELNQTSPRTSFGVGVLGTLLMSTLVGVLGVSRRRRTDVLAERMKLAAIVENSNDGIIGQNLDGIVTAWNRGAEKIFGYGSDEVLGRPLVGLILPGNLADEERQLLSRIARRERIEHFETQRLRKDGQQLDVSVTVSPICDQSGTVVGASKTVRDITLQKQAEERILELNIGLEHQVAERTSELRELNALLGNVLDSASQVSIIATDRNGIITVFNRGAEQLLGYRAEEMIGVQTPGILHRREEVEQRGRELSAEYGERIEGFRVFVHKPELEGAEAREWTYVCKDGRHFSVTLLVTAMHNADGQLSGYLGIAIDISQMKQAEQRLADSLALTRTILDTAVNPIISIDQTGVIQSCNRATETVFGYQPDELIGENVRILMPESFGQDHDQHLGAFRDRAGTGAIGINREVEARRKDGSVFPVEISLGTMRIGGQPMVVGVLFDISEQRRQRNAIASARDQLALASDVAKLGVWSWTPDDDRLQWNDRMFEIYEQPLALRGGGLNYQHWLERLHPDDADDSVARLRGLVEGQGAFETVFRLLLPSGEVRYVQAAARVERVPETERQKITGINRDITAEYELQSRLFYAKEQADTASAAKSAFLANMSHEIRTPMNAVLGMLHLVQSTDLSARQLDYIRKAHGAAQSLLGLLNDILDYSKIEAGKLQLDPHPFELELLMTDLAVVLGGNQSGKDVEVLFDLDASLPDVLMGDSLRLQQVLINLAGNALKFTEHGQVTVSLRACARRGDAVRLRVSVSDTGIGISEEQLGRIFEGFNQAETSISRRYGGTGLGLAICKRLVELMGGTLWVESRLGVGSRFWFEVELDAVKTVDSQPPGLVDDLDLRVLVVDDNAAARELLVRTVVELGWEADSACGGREAVARVAAAASERPYDVVLMDWRMPDVDGLATASILRDAAGDALPPLVVMITAYGREVLADVQRDGAAPFAAFLSKPVTSKQLATTLRSVVTGQQAGGEVIAIRPEGRLVGLRLLVVEDNPLNRQVAQELLEGEGAEVALAEGGNQGVVTVLRGAQSFDAVLMDIQMPDMDGLEATRLIRESPLHRNLPIIAMTANASASEREACLAAGMNEHVGKPIDLERLVTVLREALPDGQAALTSDRPSTLLARGDTAEGILRRFGGNLSLIRRVLAGFPDDMRTNLSRLEQLARDADKAGVLMQLHTLKGCAGTMGASDLFARVAELEQSLKQAGEEEAHAFMSDSQWLPDLHMLLESDNSRLDAAFAALGRAEPAACAMTEWTDCERALRQLQELLASGNLLAIERAEALETVVPSHCRDVYDELRQAVDSLDFRSARVLSEKLLNALEGA